MQEAAARLGCSEQYVGRLLSRNRLVGERRGRSWAVQSESVDQYLEARQAAEASGAKPARQHRAARVTAPAMAAHGANGASLPAGESDSLLAQLFTLRSENERLAAENERLRRAATALLA